MRAQSVVSKSLSKPFTAAALLLALAGCATPVTDYKKGTDFSVYKRPRFVRMLAAIGPLMRRVLMRR